MEGQQFGRLTVISKQGGGKILTRCLCGTEKVLPMNRVRIGKSRSCGCLRAEMLSERRKTHGMTNTREYRAWCHIKDRCLNEKTSNFADYGGRGIKMCERWQNSFEAFYDDMGACPKGWTIDRKDFNGNYEPGNCRWLDMRGQQNNRRNNVLIEHAGRKQTISQWAREVGLKDATLRRRIRVGEPIGLALRSDLRPGVKAL